MYTLNEIWLFEIDLYINLHVKAIHCFASVHIIFFYSIRDKNPTCTDMHCFISGDQ